MSIKNCVALAYHFMQTKTIGTRGVQSLTEHTGAQVLSETQPKNIYLL